MTARWKSELDGPTCVAEGGQDVQASGLTCERLVVRFGGVVAVDSVSIMVPRAQIVGLVGPNGSGKTTVVNAISGFVGAQGGSVTVGGHHVTGRRPDQIARLGVSRTFQAGRVFENLTVEENLTIGKVRMGTTGELLASVRHRPSVKARQAVRDQAMEVARVFGDRLLSKWQLPAGTLSYANRRRVEVARAFMGKPRAVLLDEPTAGMNPRETEELAAQVASSLRTRAACVLIIEHKTSFISSVCDYVYVLDFGRCIAEGPPQQVWARPEVRRAYLGT